MEDVGIDAKPHVAALRDAGLMPPVVGLHVQDGPIDGDEVLVIEILTPCRDDVASEIACVLNHVQYELRYVALEKDGRRPDVDYLADFDI